NMHTVSETGHTGDLLAATHLVVQMIRLLDERGIKAKDFRDGHPNLGESTPITWQPGDGNDEE
ncbi:MAG: peptidase M42, partial [Planctomycetota bacterium]